MAFFEAGIAETIVEAMRLHPENKILQVVICTKLPVSKFYTI